MKIGIVTHYYNSDNYGGNLQAYALCRILQNMGEEPEQIQVPVRGIWLDAPKGVQKNKLESCIWILSRIPGIIPRKIIRKKYEIKKRNQQRKDAFFHFNRELIPHSSQIYLDTNIQECVKEYDAFITGSDQVWNVTTYIPAFFLDFVPPCIPKFSYAASVGSKELTPIQKDMFIHSLKDYMGVSVREEDAVLLLQELSPVEVKWVLDPALLLDKKEWDKVCKERIIQTNYMFCYFLGDDETVRQAAKDYAKKHGLSIVTLPFLQGDYRKCDAGFGDIARNDISPEQFISLIKYADYIFTDSFHAVVFSLIYKKQYFAFSRKGMVCMESRIYSLSKIFGTESRFCDTEEKVDICYMEGLEAIDYSKESECYLDLKQASVRYLEENIRKAKKFTKRHQNVETGQKNGRQQNKKLV